jgi:hypothetical protein
METIFQVYFRRAKIFMNTGILLSEGTSVTEVESTQNGRCDILKPAAPSKFIATVGIPFLDLIKINGIPELASPLAD